MYKKKSITQYNEDYWFDSFDSNGQNKFDEFDDLGSEFDDLGSEFDNLGSEFDHDRISHDH